MKKNLPLVTCICITNNRPKLIEKSITYFLQQDYSNKELLISYPSTDQVTTSIIDQFLVYNDISILEVERPSEMNLGDARNDAVARANGEYICTWDDDDWYHPNRVSSQLLWLQQAGKSYKASALNQLLLYDQTSKKAYLSFLYLWENTLLCEKAYFKKNQYSSQEKGEDSTIVDYLESDHELFHIWNSPFLYIYIYHSGNTWGYEHFKSFIERSQPLSDEQNLMIYQLLNQ